MGMFDNIRCEIKLPGASEEEQNDSFQTKSLDCTMSQYTIKADGTLIHHRSRLELVPIDERPDPLRPYIGRYRETGVDDEPVNFHGIIEFYVRRSFMAYFTHGRCTHIVESDRFSQGITTYEVSYPDKVDALADDEWSVQMSEPLQAIYFAMKDSAAIGLMKPQAFTDLRDRLVATSKGIK